MIVKDTGLMAGQKQFIFNNYISIFNAYNLLRKHSPHDSIEDIGEFLGFISIDKEIPIFYKNEYSQIFTFIDHLISDAENPISTAIAKMTRFLTIDAEIEKDIIKKLEKDIFFFGEASSCLWLKSDFFNFEPIKELNLPEGQEWLSGDQTDGEPETNHQRQCEALLVENAELKNQLSKLQQAGDRQIKADFQLKKPVVQAKVSITYSQEEMQQKVAEVDQLKARTAELEEENRILSEKIEFIEKDSNLPTKSRNSVVKLIYVLTNMAKISTANPYAPYESLKTKADLLGVEKFPNKDTVGNWLKEVENLK